MAVAIITHCVSHLSSVIISTVLAGLNSDTRQPPDLLQEQQKLVVTSVHQVLAGLQ